ncbi:MAG: hypothetical protein AB1752_07235 [Candidatus Zixiibacteriota bacterium]
MTKVRCVAAVLTVIVWCAAGHAQERLAILPFGGSGIDGATQETVSRLLRSELERLGTYELVAQSEIAPLLPDAGCLETACAIEVGNQTGASKVVYASLNRLGEKIIFQYTLIDVASGQTALSESATSLYVEDLDKVTGRVASSIARQVPFDQTVEVGRVTEQESVEWTSRKANSSWGIGFGYLYPSHGYENESSVFVWDFRSIYELRNFAIDAVLGARKGVVLNVGALYIPSRRDFSPYVGAGIGFHAVDHELYYDYDYEDELNPKPKEDGFEFLFKGGLLAFRTYDFRVVLTGEYSITLNDFDDTGFVVTIGVMRAGKRVFGIF